LKFSLCAAWNPNGTTFADNSTVGVQPPRIVVSSNNTIYVSAESLNQVVALSDGNNTVIRNISDGLNSPTGIFSTINGDIYISNIGSNNQVEKWAWNATSGVIVMNVTSQCLSLFIDSNDTLYCCHDAEHKVIKTSLSSAWNGVILAAGNGTNGSGPYLLTYPNGIFVDTQFNLYVADFGNNRVQLFKPNQLNATTIAGNGAPGTITLICPSDVVVDAYGYVFIADLCNHRIIGSGPDGFRCVVGCTGSPGSASDQLQYPSSLSFDSYGNLFVDDKNNNRIQKFSLLRNSCGKFFIVFEE
jgi:tripartite motif-containing protein 71